MFFELLSLLSYFVITFLLSILIFISSYCLTVQSPETEKVSAYECGFDPYDSARKRFDVRFYIFAVLFVVFDIETMFLIPWSVTLAKTNFAGFWVIVDFLVELVVGFYYVWTIGALNWAVSKVK